MALNFPNASRSYDATRRAVRFWGHDSSMEFTFFLTEAALKQVKPNIEPGQDAALRVFDDNRQLIHNAAAKAYGRGRKGSYELASSDF